MPEVLCIPFSCGTVVSHICSTLNIQTVIIPNNISGSCVNINPFYRRGSRDIERTIKIVNVNELLLISIGRTFHHTCTVFFHLR